MRLLKNLRIVGLLIAAFFGSVVVIYVAFLVYINFPNDQVIARNVKVTNEWTELVIDPPVSAHNRDQYVTLRTYGIDFQAAGFDGVHLKNGTVLNPDIELIDVDDTTQSLHPSGADQGHFAVDAVFSPVKDSMGFVKNRRFARLRIRSDVPFDCERLAWVDYNPK
ncbi:MAG: hypothetical protein ACJ73D_03670 [Pyrinomonadaceae bacterium]